MLLFWAIVAIVLLALLILKKVLRRERLRRERQTHTTEPDIRLLAGTVFRKVEYEAPGFAIFDTANGEMRLQGKIGPNLLFAAAPMAIYMTLRSMIIGSVAEFFGGLVLAALLTVFMMFLWNRRAKKENTTIPVTVGNIRSAYQSGSAVQLKFRKAPISGLWKVEFSVAPHFYDRFFAQFEKVFPGVMEEAYQIWGKTGRCISWRPKPSSEEASTTNANANRINYEATKDAWERTHGK